MPGQPDYREGRDRRRLSVWHAGITFGSCSSVKSRFPPEHLYPADEWRIVEARYSDEFVGLTETVFSLGNGFLGVRGSFEEGRPALVPGTFLNGFHETWPISHAEGAPALAKTGQTIVNVPDTTIVKLYVDDEPFFLPTAVLQDYGRILDMRAGTLTRELVWATAAGKHIPENPLPPDGLARAPPPARDDLRGHDARRGGACRGLVTGAQPPRRPTDRRPARIPAGRSPPGDRAPAPGAQRAGCRADRTAHPAWLPDNQERDDARHQRQPRHRCGVLVPGTEVPRRRDGRTTPHGRRGARRPIRITKYATYQTSRGIPVPELIDRCRRAWTARSGTGSTCSPRLSARISTGSGTAPMCGCGPQNSGSGLCYPGLSWGSRSGI